MSADTPPKAKPSLPQLQLGPYSLQPALCLAPMAGVTDRPFRQLCRRLGAGYAVSEMLTAIPSLQNTRKSQWRRNHEGESGPIAVQIAGTDPQQLAEAARFNVAHGAQIIDINMGCPAKKVCNVLAGSALMRDETLVAQLLRAVVQAVPVPVTLKIRTGWDAQQRNAVRIAQIAEAEGIQMLAVHGRTRQDFYQGEAEYATIAAVKQAVRVPVIANGDIDSPAKARQVLALTQADGLMIGRAAQGQPWIFQQLAHELATGEAAPAITMAEFRQWVLQHLQQIHDFYGEFMGCRIARKHIAWYTRALPDGEAFWQSVHGVEQPEAQHQALVEYLDRLAAKHHHLPETPTRTPQAA